VFGYSVNNESEPTSDRNPLTFTETYLRHVDIVDFWKNARGEFGTRTATLHAAAIVNVIFVMDLFQNLRGFVVQRPG